MFSGFDDSSAFVGVLAVFEACGVAGWAFPFCSATGTSGFILIAPNLQIAAAHMAFDICWLRLKEIAQSRASFRVLY